jgi:hypothetical protein
VVSGVFTATQVVAAATNRHQRDREKRPHSSTIHESPDDCQLQGVAMYFFHVAHNGAHVRTGIDQRRINGGDEGARALR